MSDLQCALLVCEKWARRVGMNWALSKWKSQFVISRRMAERYKHVPIPGGEIKTVIEARYLGVLMSANGIMRQSIRERIQMAHATLTTLQSAKLLFSGDDFYYIKMVYRTLIQSKLDYVSFLCPCSTVSYHAFESHLQRLFQSCIGMRVKKPEIPRVLMMFNLETLGDGRRVMANAFASRLCNIQNDDTAADRQKLHARNTQKAFETSISFRRIVTIGRDAYGKDQLMRMKERKRERIQGIMRRPIPRMKGVPLSYE